MTQRTIDNFVYVIRSKPPKQNYFNKTDVYHIDDTWSLDILDIKHYGPENNGGYRYVLVGIDDFSRFGCTVLLKRKMLKQ